VLDDGFVALVDCMGDDGAVVQAARVSYGEGTRKVSDDRQLIRYLMRHAHTTPFEMAEIKFVVRVPMDCWRQWIRHRTANVNEYSARYSIMDREFYIPTAENVAAQSEVNNQGRGAAVSAPDLGGAAARRAQRRARARGQQRAEQRRKPLAVHQKVLAEGRRGGGHPPKMASRKSAGQERAVAVGGYETMERRAVQQSKRPRRQGSRKAQGNALSASHATA
jgi:flavin-dependent thymidylate synthase